MKTVKNIYFKIRNIFVYSLVNKHIREQIGIRLVSPIIRNQGYFLWIEGNEGVYDLFAIPNDEDNQANYLIKYYPSTEEDNYRLYPQPEKELRTNYIFKEGAPLWDDRENVMAEHFIAGRMDLLWEEQAIWATLTVTEDAEKTLPLMEIGRNFYDRFLRALCIFNKTTPSLVTQKTTLNGTTKINQLMTILLPIEFDKAPLINEICELLGAKAENSTAKTVTSENWEPLYIEGVSEIPSVTTTWLDGSWWTLPAKTAAYLPEDLNI